MVSEVLFARLTIWKYLIIPDFVTRILTYIFNNIINLDIYVISAPILFVIYFSCVYFPIAYIFFWQKSKQVRTESNSTVLIQLYIILSASSSNAAFVLAGGASFQNLWWFFKMQVAQTSTPRLKSQAQWQKLRELELTTTQDSFYQLGV